MGDDRNRILDLLASGRITTEEATRLLDALDSSAGKGDGADAAGAAAAGAKTGWPKFFASGDKTAAGAGGAAGGKGSGTGAGGTGSKHAFMYVKVVSEKGDNVNVKVPLGLLRAGLKFTSLIPKQASDEINKAMREKGMSFDISNFRPEDVEELIAALSEMEVEVDSNNGDHVRVFVA
jgi:hypothetical protein